jgi:hypothetical protein
VPNALHSLNIRAIFNQNDGAPGENISILETRLKQLRHVIVVFAEVEESWVLGRLSVVSEIANKEKLPLKLGIYYGPQHHKGNGGQIKLGSLIVYEIDDADLLNPQTLLSLFSEG